MNASNSTTPTIQAPPGHTPESDFAHLVAMRSGFVCAFCGATEGLIPSPIVPESYGGSTDASNFRSLCGPCDRLRHNAEGSSPNPPYPEDLQHLYDIGWPELTAGILSLLHEAATISEVDRKSTRLNSSHLVISYAVFCLKKKKT